MSTPPLPVTRLDPRAVVPARAHRWDAGLDLAALDPVDVPAGGRAEARTGLAIAVPEGWGGLVLPRSGLARRHGLTVTNAPGLIDAGYRGEVIVLLANLGDEDVHVDAGARVAQLMLVPVWTGAVREVAALPPSDGRDAGGFGSSGA